MEVGCVGALWVVMIWFVITCVYSRMGEGEGSGGVGGGSGHPVKVTSLTRSYRFYGLKALISHQRLNLKNL